LRDLVAEQSLRKFAKKMSVGAVWYELTCG
jgi:hypothetical protein